MTYGKCLVKGLEEAPAYRENFYKGSRCNYVSCDTPSRAPDYVSDSGSVYWYTDEGVYRNADHWGPVATCNWLLDGDIWPDWNRRTGFCPWDGFKGTVKEVEKIIVVKNKRYIKVGQKFIQIQGVKYAEILDVKETWVE